MAKDKQAKWLSISDCPPEQSIYEFNTAREARQAKWQIDKTGCCGQCIGHHIVIRADKYRSLKDAFNN